MNIVLENPFKNFLSSLKPLGRHLVTTCYNKRKTFLVVINSYLPIPSRGGEAMTSLVDSEAQFNLRLEQVRVPQPLRIALRNSGITTISSLAYAHGQPGQPIVAEDFTTWVRQMEPTATIGAVSSLKRLLFESQTQLLAMLKEQVTNPEPTAARRVPQAEREARLANLRNRLSGVLIEGHSEPSHTLLDLATQLYDQNVLRCIPLEKCYSRLTELAATNKTQTKLLEVESSKIIVKDKDAEIETNVQSSYQLLEALKRRGLALDFAGVMSFTRHDKYVQASLLTPEQRATNGLQ